MRYLYTILLLFCVVCAYGQNTNTRPWVDVYVNDDLLLPQRSYDDRTRSGNNIEGGIDVLFRKKPHKIYMSLGNNIGYMNLVSESNTGKVNTGNAFHGSLFLGVNYLSSYKSLSPIRVGLVAGPGFKFDGTTSLGFMPYLFSRLTAIKYINRYLGAGLNVSWYYNLCTLKSYAKHSSTIDEGISFNIWSVGASVRFSIGPSKHK